MHVLPKAAGCFQRNSKQLPRRECFLHTIARQGHNLAAMNAKIDALGLTLDSDPRRVTKTGVMQADLSET